MKKDQILSLTAQSATPKRVSLALAILLAMGVIILIWSEIWVFAMVIFWALTGLFRASQFLTIVLAVVIFGPSLWASWYIARLAIEAEREAGSDDPLSDR